MLESSGLCFSVYALFFKRIPAERGFYDLCARMHTPDVAFMTSNIKGYIIVPVCVCCIYIYILAVIRVEWQSVMQQPYCPDPARGVLIFTVLKVQLGTSVLLTTADFHRLIPCPVWLCRFCGLSSRHITHSLLLCSINHMNCIPLIWPLYIWSLRKDESQLQPL